MSERWCSLFLFTCFVSGLLCCCLCARQHMLSQRLTFKLRHIDVHGGWDRLDRWWVGKTRQHPTVGVCPTISLSRCKGAHQLYVLACISIMDLAARARAGGALLPHAVALRCVSLVPIWIIELGGSSVSLSTRS